MQVEKILHIFCMNNPKKFYFMITQAMYPFRVIGKFYSKM